MDPLSVLRERYAQPDARAMVDAQYQAMLDQSERMQKPRNAFYLPDVGAPALGNGGQFSAGSPAVNKAADVVSEVANDFIIPQTPLDWGLTLATGGAGRLLSPLAKVATIAGSHMLTADPAEAGKTGLIKSAVDQFWHPISGIKLPKPLSEYFSTHEPRAKIIEKKVKPEDFEGKMIYPTITDTTRPDTWLTHVGDYKLPEPVAMQGGGRFPAVKENRPEVWMASDAAMKGLANRVEQIGAREGKDVVVMPTALGGTGGDYSHHVWNPLAQYIGGNAQHKISNEGWVAFNQAMRQGDPNFPGLGISPDRMLDYFNASARSPRTNFVQTMDTRRFQDAGFPDVAAFRHAATDPELLHAPLGSSGFSSFTLDPSKGIYPADIHGTYTHAGSGKNFGSMGIIAPPELMFSDVMESLKKMAAETGKPVRKYTGRPDYYFAGRIPEKLKSGEPLAQAQFASPQWVDTISDYARRYKKVGGAAALASGMTMAEIAKASEAERANEADRR